MEKIILSNGHRTSWTCINSFIVVLDRLYLALTNDFHYRNRKMTKSKKDPLRDTIESFHATHSKSLAFTSLSQNLQEEETVDHERNLLLILQQFEHASCYDRRDKLYGLHSMVNQFISFPVDYDIDVYELFYRACQFLDKTDTWPKMGCCSREDTVGEQVHNLERSNDTNDTGDLDHFGDIDEYDDSDIANDRGNGDNAENLHHPHGTREEVREDDDQSEVSEDYELNHFMKLAEQLIRNFDLGPLDLILRDQAGRTFAVPLVERSSPRESYCCTLYHPKDYLCKPCLRPTNRRRKSRSCHLRLLFWESVPDVGGCFILETAMKSTTNYQICFNVMFRLQKVHSSLDQIISCCTRANGYQKGFQ